MKKNYLLFIALLVTYLANAQAPFITTWQVTDENTSPTGGRIIISIIEDDNIPDSCTIDFGDGTVLTNQSGEVSHTYASAGVYTVTMSGNFTRIKASPTNTFDPLNSYKLKTIEQWGAIQWTSMELAFIRCDNLIINAIDAPDLSNTSSLRFMFEYCASLNQSLNHWDVSSINNMEGMFSHCSYNQPLNNWDVSNVTNMSKMFHESNFNQPIGNWNVSSVINMSRMFGDTPFNQPLNDWDVSSVTNMSSMFSGATSFNQPLNDWDVSNVTNMSSMFSSAFLFNQQLNNWNVSNVNDISAMFFNANLFNQLLNNWNVSNVTDMSLVFFGCFDYNQPLNNWDVSNVTDMSAMFGAATSFNQPLNNWDISNVINMGAMFTAAENFNQDLSDWNFNADVTFESFDLVNLENRFLSLSGMDIINYDALLNRFKELGLANKRFGAEEILYCDENTRNYLIDELGWVIEGDNLAEDCTADIPLLDDNQVFIYPNPVNDFLHIENKSDVVVERVIIYNLQGRELINMDENLSIIKVDNLSTGVYIVNLITDSGSSEFKLIKN